MQLLRTVAGAGGVLTEGEQLLQLPARKNFFGRGRLMDYFLPLPGRSTAVRTPSKPFPHLALSNRLLSRPRSGAQALEISNWKKRARLNFKSIAVLDRLLIGTF